MSYLPRPTGPVARLLFPFFVLSLLTVSPMLHRGAAASPSGGQPSVQAVFDGVVRVQARIAPTARSARTLGVERDGSGVVIDDEGLVLTVGYLLLEADEVEIGLANGRKVPATPLAYDHGTGFALLRASQPLGVKPIELGLSDRIAPDERVLVVSHGGQSMAMPAIVVSRRSFAGPWEYLLDNAIFTAPPHPAFGGAALLTPAGKLIGVGSLIVGDAAGPEQAVPGNMFIPIDRLKPILADLLEGGRPAGRGRPWLGLYSEEVRGRLFVTRVAPGSPAAMAGLEECDLVVGIDGKPVAGLAEFYRAVWALGAPGVTVPLDVLRGVVVKRLAVKSGDRGAWLSRSRSY